MMNLTKSAYNLEAYSNFYLLSTTFINSLFTKMNECISSFPVNSNLVHFLDFKYVCVLYIMNFEDLFCFFELLFLTICLNL